MRFRLFYSIAVTKVVRIRPSGEFIRPCNARTEGHVCNPAGAVPHQRNWRCFGRRLHFGVEEPAVRRDGVERFGATFPPSGSTKAAWLRYRERSAVVLFTEPRGPVLNYHHRPVLLRAFGLKHQKAAPVTRANESRR